MIYIVPTILEVTRETFMKRFEALRPHFLAMQVDVMNDTSVSGTSFADPQLIDTLHHEIRFEIDLMVNIDSYDLDQWNTPWVDKVIFHVESSSEPRAVIDRIRSWNKKVFISLNPETDASAAAPFLKYVDGVLLLAVHPGKSGNPFIPTVLDTIKELRERNADLDIEVDGGVTNETLLPMLDVGANGFAVGSFFDNRVVEERSLQLLTIIEQFEQRQRYVPGRKKKH